MKQRYGITYDGISAERSKDPLVFSLPVAPDTQVGHIWPMLRGATDRIEELFATELYTTLQRYLRDWVQYPFSALMPSSLPTGWNVQEYQRDWFVIDDEGRIATRQRERVAAVWAAWCYANARGQLSKEQSQAIQHPKFAQFRIDMPMPPGYRMLFNHDNEVCFETEKGVKSDFYDNSLIAHFRAWKHYDRNCRGYKVGTVERVESDHPEIWQAEVDLVYSQERKWTCVIEVNDNTEAGARDIAQRICNMLNQEVEL